MQIQSLDHFVWEVSNKVREDLYNSCALLPIHKDMKAPTRVQKLGDFGKDYEKYWFA